MACARTAMGASGALVTPDGSVLLVRRSYPPDDWVMPGGDAERGESPVATFQREGLEEIGLRVAPVQLTGVYHQLDHPAGAFMHFVFLARISARAPIRSDPREVAEWDLFAPQALPLPMTASTRIRLLDAMSPRDAFVPTDLPPGSDR